MSISTRTIDYYTNIGIIHALKPSANNKYRHYDEETIVRLKLIQLYKKENLTLSDIKKRFELMESAGNCDSEIAIEKVHAL